MFPVARKATKAQLADLAAGLGVGVPDTLAVVRSAIKRMILLRPLFTSLSLRLDLVEDNTLSTLATDGVSMLINGSYFNSLTWAQQETAVAHETMHCASLHMTRRKRRDPQLWNMAGDYFINLTLQDAGFSPIPGWLCLERFRGLSTDAIYSILLAEGADKSKAKGCVMDAPTGQKGKAKGKAEGSKAGKGEPGKAGKPKPGGGQGEPQEGLGKGAGDGGDGEGETPGKPGAGQGGAGKGQEQGGEERGEGEEGGEGAGQAPRDLDQEWQDAVAAAGILGAKQAGRGAGGILRAVKAERESPEDWRSVLQRWCVNPGDYSYARPNRRFIAGGEYRPGRAPEAPRLTIVAPDASGSIDPVVLASFCAEFNAIQAALGYSGTVWCVVWDDGVRHAEEIQGDLDLSKVRAGGGTTFGCVPAWIQKQGLQPDVLIVLTDLKFSDTARLQDPGYPVLWVTRTPVPPRYVPSFGEHVVCSGRDQ